jgi:hypothetical protein
VLFQDKEFSKLPAMPMLLQLKRNIINNLRMRRTLLELLDGYKNLEVLFTTHQLLRSMDYLEEDKNNLLLKEKNQFHLLHPNLTNKKLIP